ncbi:PTS mannitol transporter subunit IICBA [Lachnospiraceae bacterium 54-53]
MKEKIQVFGRALSGMVMPNIGAFIAWGLITALFIETGWAPNAAFAELVGPMSSILLPLLIAYTGGMAVAGQRGAVIGALASMGVIVGSDVPMFMGAMMVGPLAAWILKKFDIFMESRIKAGFEMLVNNFSLGIIGGILAVLTRMGIRPVVEVLNHVMSAGVGFFVDNNLLPLASVFIEPAKILFLNNAINHGILSPMGIQQVQEIGKSIFFLLEANPGPGLGILLAYCIAGKGSAKSSAPGAIIIHFLGGIHEIYFPYILMNPLLLIAAIAGGASGVFIFHLMNVGLTAPASPGSIFAVLLMAERNSYAGLLLGIIISAAVAMAVALPLLKFMSKDTDLKEAEARKNEMKRQAKGIKADETMNAVNAVKTNETTAREVEGAVSKIAFACDAGMGSSAMGATVLKKKIAGAGLTGIEVIHTPVSSIPDDVQVIVTHKELKERAARSNANARLVLIENFLAAPEYDELIEYIKSKQ